MIWYRAGTIERFVPFLGVERVEGWAHLGQPFPWRSMSDVLAMDPGAEFRPNGLREGETV